MGTGALAHRCDTCKVALQADLVLANGATKGPGAVQKISKDGGPVSSLVDNEDVPCALAMFKGKPYWSNAFLGQLRTLDGNGVLRILLGLSRAAHGGGWGGAST